MVEWRRGKAQDLMATTLTKEPLWVHNAPWSLYYTKLLSTELHLIRLQYLPQGSTPIKSLGSRDLEFKWKNNLQICIIS